MASEVLDPSNLVKMLFYVLKEKKLTFCSCESLTGGLFGATICSVPGASDFFRGGVITYVDDVKARVGVSRETLSKYTAISEECAREMALSAAKFTGSDVGISFTGNAGPTAQDGKPVGDVWIGISKGDQVKAVHCAFQGNRNEIRQSCVMTGLRLLITALGD